MGRGGRRGRAGSATRLAASVGLTMVAVVPAVAPVPAAATDAPSSVSQVDPALFDPLSWRGIGPNRGGRSIAVAGSAARPNEYYFGATGGGVWKTVDGGVNWNPVGDGHLSSSSVGAVDVCASNPDVVYVGMGEVQLRGDIIAGDGVYKTTDGGRTWRHLGLADTQMIGRLRVDPTDCDRVYVAALGHAFGTGGNAERGVFRSTDGGANWQRVLFRDERTGAVDLVVDPSNPRVLYASFWHAFRLPWQLVSGGPGSGLFKSTDGGDTWTELTANPGLPTGVLGKIGVSVSPVDPSRVYAIVEAAEGGVFVSDDAGATWRRSSADRNLRQRAFYYTRLVADPVERDTVYVLNVQFWKSTDAGRTFRSVPTPHGDNHDLWIAPDDNQRMIEGNDGGANVSTNGGQVWTEQDYSTAQMYHVVTTNHTPYLVCGSQQDNNNTGCVSSAGGSQFVEIGGGESGYVAVDPRDSNVFYGGNFGGALERTDLRTGQVRDINAWPDNPMGHPAQDLRHRFQWTFPIMTTPAEPRAVYAGSQFVLKSTNGGQSWQRISPDLTRADSATLGDSGGPITKDQTSIEYYATVFTIAPSQVDSRVIWAGSDDGLAHVTSNGGRSWRQVTPAGLPRFTRMSMIDAGHHSAGTAYLAAHRYRLDDPAPYAFRTHDGGRTWTKITDGLPDNAFLWALREDPQRAGLLYAATQHGVHVSFDDGDHWQSLTLNLPDVSVQDLTVKDGDLVIATHGRGFFVLDDGATLLRQLEPGGRAVTAFTPTVPAPAAMPTPATVATTDQARPRHTATATATSDGVTLFDPADPIRRVDPGVRVFYRLDRPATDVRLTFLDQAGRQIRTFTDLDTTPGTHDLTWNLRHPPATAFPGLIYWSASTTAGPLSPWGAHQVRLTVDGATLSQRFEIRGDPRLTQVSRGDIDAQFALATRVRDRTSDANAAVVRIRACVPQIQDRVTRAGNAAVTAAGQTAVTALSNVENSIYQTRLQSSQDPLNFPIRINNKIAALLGVIESAESRPTDQTHQVFAELSGRLQVQLDRLDTAVAEDVAALNALLPAFGLPAVNCPPAAP